MTQYYVSPSGNDANAGTSTATAWLTLLRAGSAGSVVVGGDTVNFLAGTYSATTTTVKAGSAGGSITYLSPVREAAVFVGPSGSPHVWKNTGGYVTIDGFEIKSDGSVRLGIYGTITSGTMLIQNCHVHDIGTTIACSTGGAGIDVDNVDYQPAFYDILYCKVHDCGLSKGSGCTQIHGIYTGSPANVKNCLVYKGGYGAIHLWHDADSCIIANNTIFNTTVGIVVGTGNWNWRTTPGDNNQMYNNIIVDCTYGMSEQSGVGGHGTHNDYVDNLIYNTTFRYDQYGDDVGLLVGDLNSDPLMVNYIAAGGGDYHLLTTSPAKDSGTATYGQAIDLDGTSCPQNGVYDRGCYEFIVGGGSSGDGVAGSPKNWRRKVNGRRFR